MRGLSLIEYALLAAIIAVMTIGAMRVFGVKVNTKYNQLVVGAGGEVPGGDDAPCAEGNPNCEN